MKTTKFDELVALLRYLFILRSSAARTDGISTIYSPRRTCPPSCALYEKPDGSAGPCKTLRNPRTAGPWASISEPGAPGLEKWAHRAGTGESLSLTEVLEAIPYAFLRSRDRILRWGVGGELPGLGESAHAPSIVDIVTCVDDNRGTLIAYTHRSDPTTFGLVDWALTYRNGTAINISLDNFDHVDRLLAQGLPCTVIVPRTHKSKWRVLRTAKNKRVVRCPAEYGGTFSCATCGNGNPLCARPRDYAIGFTPSRPTMSAILPIISQTKTCPPDTTSATLTKEKA